MSNTLIEVLWVHCVEFYTTHAGQIAKEIEKNKFRSMKEQAEEVGLTHLSRY
jgi:hypothetical protein